MTVRGFSGELPLRNVSRFGAGDAVFLALFVLAFVGVRQFGA
jgi:hypothetical protein